MPKVKKRKSLSKKPSKKLQKSKTKPVRKKPKKKLVTKKHNVTIKHHVTIKPAKIEKPKPTTEIVMQPILLKVVLPKEIKDTNQEFIPDLNKLSPWESRQFLKNLIFNKGLKFYCMSRASPEFQGVMSLLDKSPYQDVSGHFVISIKSLNQIVGALDIL